MNLDRFLAGGRIHNSDRPIFFDSDHTIFWHTRRKKELKDILQEKRIGINLAADIIVTLGPRDCSLQLLKKILQNDCI